MIDPDPPDEIFLDNECLPDGEAFDPERLRECAYWRCGELFEWRTANQIFCGRACRHRQRKWERAQARRARRS